MGRSHQSPSHEQSSVHVKREVLNEILENRLSSGTEAGNAFNDLRWMRGAKHLQHHQLQVMLTL